MSRIKVFLISTLCFLHALTVETQTINETLALKGKLSSYHTEMLLLPFDAKLTALQPFGHLVEKDEPIYQVKPLSKDKGLLNTLYEYIQSEQALFLEKQHMQAQEALISIEAISKRAYHEAKLKYEKQNFEFLEKQKKIVKLLEHYDLSLEDIHALPNYDIETLESFVRINLPPDQLFAPRSGILLPINDQQGDVAVFKAMTHYAKIVDPRALQIEIQVSEKQLSKLHTGQSTNIFVPVLNQSFEGSIFNINLYPSNTGINTQYTVTVRFNELSETDYQNLLLGMNTIVNVSLAQKEAILIPISAVKSVMDKDMVTISQNNRFKELREVTLGATQGIHIEVISGLQPGEEILEHYST